MLTASSLDDSIDAPLSISNSTSAAITCDVQWATGWGARYGGTATIPPGTHNADDIGLFYNLAQTDAGLTPTDHNAWYAPATVKVGADITLTRRLVLQGVTTEFVDTDGLRGVLFTPPEPRRSMAVVCLTGSGGGYDLAHAGALSAHGFVAFALAYFNVPGLPQSLANIPLEYLKLGIDWLYARSRANKVAVLGGSKGGELALLLGATFPDVRAVIATVPSSQTLPWGTKDGWAPCWTYRAEGMPWAPIRGERNPPPLPSGRIIIRPGYEATIEHLADVERTAIPIERTNGPIMLISGELDAMWPSSDFSRLAVKRAKAHGFAHELVHLNYPEAGHAIYVPNYPGTQSKFDTFEMGGTPRANALASRHSWNETLAFLERYSA